jgi:5-methylcytosine-specific restriction enzyme A
MCFGSRGDRSTQPKRHYQVARAVAERALTQRLLITIGGGDMVPEEFAGRVLNIVSVSSVYGETEAFIQDPATRERLAQWPTAVALRDIYDVNGSPHLVEDLGFIDLRILENAFDQVIRPEEKIMQLWEALQGWELTLKDAAPLIGFRDQNRLQLVGTFLPGHVSAEEGKRLYREAGVLERDRRLVQEVKRRNCERNGGLIICEGCGFSDGNASLFDAHHLVPLSVDIRVSVPSDFSVLCPTCHRVCHSYGQDKARPLPITELRH